MDIEKAKKLVRGLAFNDDGTMVNYIDFTSADYDSWNGYTLKEYAEAIETLLTAYEKEKEKNKKIEKELEKHIKFCEQEAEGSLNNEICHIALKFNKGLLDIINEEE